MNMRWSKLGRLPGRHGLAGAFAGRHGDHLFVAGGTNFPEQPMVEGGKRCWHDSIHLYDLKRKRWKKGGQWPHPVAGGGSVTTARGIVCAGGANAEGHLRASWLVNIEAGKARLHSLPDLPKPLSGMGMAAHKNTVFVLGGQHESGPSSTSEFLALDLVHPERGWEGLPALPAEGIMNVVLSAVSGAVFAFGGIRIEKEANVGFSVPYLDEAWVFRKRWKRLSSLPHRSGAAPSPALTWDGKTFHVLGGADGSNLQQTPNSFGGFPRRIMAYEKTQNRWSVAGEMPVGALVTPLVPGCDDDFYLLGGETGPGLRSREIWHITKP